MHPLFERSNALSKAVIGAAIEVHRIKGPGLIESIYEKCLKRELELRKIEATSQEIVRVECKGHFFEEPLRFDLLVEGCLLLELKSVQQVIAVHKAQLLSYMKLLDVPIGLLINFYETKLMNGIHRLILPGGQPVREPSVSRIDFASNASSCSSLFPSLPSVKILYSLQPRCDSLAEHTSAPV